MNNKRIYLNAFVMNTPGHMSAGLWTHPDNDASGYRKSEYWIKLARLLEKGRFDAVFLADVLGTYDVYRGSRDPAVRRGAQAPVNDPSYIVPLMSAVTNHLGFGLTASVTHEHPYTFARRMTTLDHLTNGRVGWNIVTSYLNSAAVNIGLDKQIGHDERYDIAQEYLEVCYKLWEESWEEDAVVADKETGIYANPEKVHDIHHEGKYYKVPGAHLSEPSPQRTPVLFQAGASPRGREFASKNAELVFINAPSIEAGRETVKRLRADFEKNGRKPEDIKILTMLTPIIGETEESAHQKLEEFKKHISHEGAFALFGGWTGIDLSEFDDDDVLTYVENDSMRSVIEVLTRVDPDKQWTIKELRDFIGIGGILSLIHI